MVRETYADSDAVLSHLGNVGPLLGRLVYRGGGLELAVFGDPSAALRDAIAGFQPRIFSFDDGK